MYKDFGRRIAIFVCWALIGLATGAAAAGVTTVYKYDKNGNLTEAVDVSSDVNNCGGIAAACAAGNVCCLGACSNLSSDLANCGGCGTICSNNHIAPVCSGGSCASGTCASGYADCNSNKQTDGCETATATDVANCGGCGVVCSTNHITRACVGGSCASGTCASGYADCNSNKQTDGCETATATDVANCGGCGVVCSTNHITRTCVAGSCASGTCASGYADCNSNKQTDGCEITLATDLDHCGSCTTPCSTNHITRACVAGSCASGTCASGYADCNNNKQTDGCEININTDRNNCGACGHVCSAGLTCCGGGCVNLMTSSTNCGSCGFRCGSSEVCSAGECSCSGRGCLAPVQ